MKYNVVFISGAVVVALAILYFYHYDRSYMFSGAKSSPEPPPSPSVTIGKTVIPVEIAKGILAVQKGLSGRPSLHATNGMLFVFGSAGKYRFWMPDMNFPIDIIWMNNGKVVDISHDVPNDFNLLSPKLFSPQEPAQFVLEVNAGFARKGGIEVGDSITFTGIE